ncbi:MAG: hypothetical protein HY921_09465 [Elusimicrobia bacterium]|nr:hypothetical protein [Elusimicrobiota bacterium]
MALQANEIKFTAFDAQGRVMDLQAFLGFIGRADKTKAPPAILVSSPDGLTAQKPTLKQEGASLVLGWEGLSRVSLSMVWPVAEDGFSAVWLDKGGPGYSEGETLQLNEEIALSQYRALKEAWTKHSREMEPAYRPSRKAEKTLAAAQSLLERAQAQASPAKRAALFNRALSQTARSWQTMLFEHGVQIAQDPKRGPGLRFGLTLHEAVLQRMSDYDWIIDMIQRSGANWVRVVFRSNPRDFTYAQPGSFNEYDAVVKALRDKNIRVMGCVLDTSQWPAALTPAIYAERAKNLVLHYRGLIHSWEVGSEINGHWLGGRAAPLPPEQAFRIYSEAAAQVKAVEASLETVATLYWQEAASPDEAHSLFGWLSRFVPEGFGQNLDVVGLSLQPDENPVGLSLERIFERTRLFLPDKKLMVSSLGYVEGSELKGWWWLDPQDVEGARKDLVNLYSAASCAFPRSLCGVFWWQTLDQMLPGERKYSDLYRVYKRTLDQLGH